MPFTTGAGQVSAFDCTVTVCEPAGTGDEIVSATFDETFVSISVVVGNATLSRKARTSGLKLTPATRPDHMGIENEINA